MTSISPAGASLLDRIGASRASTVYRPAAGTPQARSEDAAAASRRTQVTLQAGSTGDLVYAMPKGPALGAQRLWSAARDDDISALMARNSGREAHTLSDRWRGLGGALLKQLAETGDSYQQTLADDVPPVDGDALDAASGADPAAAAVALKDQAVSGVSTNAATLELTIKTRSGQTVELKIGVNEGSKGGTRGLQVDVKSSGPLGASERDALTELAGGLDQTLESLGEGAPSLDLSRLAAFGQNGALAELDLKVDDPNAPADVPGRMKSFAMHLGADKKSLALQTTSGEMNLEVDATAGGTANGQQRWNAVDRLLKQIDAAAERAHADAGMTKNFKEAFKQLQAPASEVTDTAAGPQAAVKDRDPAIKAGKREPADQDAAAPVLSDPLRSQVQSMQSGLADFKASFSADSQRTNRFGGVKEAGHAEYRIGQTTSSRVNEATGGQSITQSQTETLSASYQKSRTYLLDRAGGNYDATTVQDSRAVTTLIDTTRDAVARAMRKTDERQLRTFTEVENQRARSHQEWPQERSVVERLR